MRSLFRLFPLILALFVSGCVGSAQYRAIQELKKHPNWPFVRSAAQSEVLRREIQSNWRVLARPEENDALFPTEYKDGVCKVTAAADYPNNRYGEIVHLEVSDDGRILTYRNLMKERHKSRDG